jgi:hypothetical protein
VEEVKREAARFLKVKAVWQFFEAERDGNAIHLFAPAGVAPIHTFRFGRQRREDGLCLSDYILEGDLEGGPEGGNAKRDHLAVLVVTAGAGVRERSEDWKNAGAFFKAHAIQALAIETAEATAEWLHRRIPSRQHSQSFLSRSSHCRTSTPEYLILACHTKSRKSFISKSIAPGIPLTQQGIPFAAAPATIGETHRAKTALPMRLQISSMLPKPPKQSGLPRHQKMHTDARASVSQRLPAVQKQIYTFAAKSNIMHANGPCNPISSCLRGEVALQAAHLPKSRNRFSTLGTLRQTALSAIDLPSESVVWSTEPGAHHE